MFATAAAVVCHGAGPSMLEVLEHRLTPIVVPRQRSLGEHVDDHQVWFSGMLEEEGQVRIADSSAALTAMLNAAVEDPAMFRFEGEQIDRSDVVESFGVAVAPPEASSGTDRSDPSGPLHRQLREERIDAPGALVGAGRGVLRRGRGRASVGTGSGSGHAVRVRPRFSVDAHSGPTWVGRRSAAGRRWIRARWSG